MPRQRLIRVLEKIFDEKEFLAPGGIRSISKYHEAHPFILKVNSHEYRIDYEPAEARTALFGGNSNWRGPIWVPINYLFIESLKKYYSFFADPLMAEFPSGSGTFLNLWDAAKELSRMLSGMFIRDADGKVGARRRRPLPGPIPIFAILCCSMNIFMVIPVKGWRQPSNRLDRARCRNDPVVLVQMSRQDSLIPL